MFFISHSSSLGSSLFLVLYCLHRRLLHPHNATQPPFPLLLPGTSYYISSFISCVALTAIYIWLTCLFVFKEPLWRWWPSCLFFTILDSSIWGSCPYKMLNNNLLHEFMDMSINKGRTNPSNQRHKTRSPECRKIHVAYSQFWLMLLLFLWVFGNFSWLACLPNLSSHHPAPQKRRQGEK